MIERLLTTHEPLFVGDDLALDFINTRYGVDAAYRDCFVDDASVLVWLKQAGIVPPNLQHVPQGLHRLAIALRDKSRALVDAAKAGRDADVEVVNQVVEAGRAANVLVWNAESRTFQLLIDRRVDSAESLLEPVARALLELLTQAPLACVQQCEAHDCTLLFRDLTKSHRRRWCSMALCGNRMKVAAFRARQKNE
jgi:predicted RNA-binding Zn ribbon-like protein